MNKYKKVDYHIHTDFSDGEASVVRVLKRAREVELDCIAITDHYDPFDRHLVKPDITEQMLASHFRSIRSMAEAMGLNVLCGIETCTDFEGNLRLGDKLAELCDIIITSPHYVECANYPSPGDYYNESYWERYREKVLNMAGGQGDILGHAEGYLPLGAMLIPGATTYETRKEICRKIAEHFFNREYIRELSTALKRSGKALELHCATRTPRESVVAYMAQAGVSFSIGSDAHRLDAVGDTGWGMELLERVHGRLLWKRPGESGCFRDSWEEFGC